MITVGTIVEGNSVGVDLFFDRVLSEFHSRKYRVAVESYGINRCLAGMGYGSH